MKLAVKIFFILAIVGCENSSNEKKLGNQTETEMFPVTAFFNQQIKEVDSLQLPAIQYLTVKDKTDTLPISMVEFRRLAGEFTEPDITKPAFKNFYKESSFADQSIPSVTLTYGTDRKHLPIQRMDIIIKPDPVMNDRVETVYIEKVASMNDTLISKKLYWKANNNFQIITSKQVSSNPELVSKLKVEWGFTN